MTAFGGSVCLGELPPAAIAEYLESVLDPDGAAFGLAAQGVGQGMSLFGDRPDLMTGIRVGFLPAGEASTGRIIPASAVVGDRTLIGSRIKVTLDLFYVERYPGFGEHSIVCEFSGRNQSQGQTEEVRFALNACVRDGNGAGVSGAPIFVGLEVGPDGISLEGRTVNIRNSGDEWLTAALGSSTFRSGLELVNTVQPVLKPFIKLAADAVNSAAKRRLNMEVSRFNLGLDFSGTPTTAKLALGSYVVVQGDGHSWSWDDFGLDEGSNVILARSSHLPLKLNYMVLGVSRTDTVASTPPRPKARGASPTIRQ